VGHVGRGTQHAVGVLTAFSAAFVLITARLLVPDARGFGTHEQLGLPACAFLAWTGWPCPTCGLTTSFAHAAHGDLARAFSAHVLGPGLFAVTVLLVPFGLWASVFDEGALMARLHPARCLIVAILCLFGAWIARIVSVLG
jgi:hypothetical protein